MPRVTVAVGLITIALAAWEITASASHPIPAVPVYHPDPAHIWNRLYAALLARQDASGQTLLADSLDAAPPRFSRHLLERKSHHDAMQALNEFAETHAENLIRDPLKRALFTRDLWAVFDWSVARAPLNANHPTYDTEKRELQERLAEILHRVSLSSKEIESLPDNYGQALGSGEFAKDYDPNRPDCAFLPTDLFDQHGPWVMVQGTDKPAAEQHVSIFSGRSRFLIFIRLPAGRKATYDYLRELWQYPQPWTDRADAPGQADLNPALPSFPAGTQVALVRQMTIFDEGGNLRPAPITESIQIRVFRSVVTLPNAQPAGLSAQIEASGQQFYEIRLDRKLLFSGHAGGLRAVAPEEKELFVFNAMPIDGLDNPKTRVDWSRIHPIVQQCVWCHARPGIQSLNSRAALLKPNALQLDPGYELPARWWEQDGTLEWKKRQADWGLLNGYWKQSLAY